MIPGDFGRCERLCPRSTTYLVVTAVPPGRTSEACVAKPRVAYQVDEDIDAARCASRTAPGSETWVVDGFRRTLTAHALGSVGARLR